ncbi:sigma 54-interacting transcriptional regulator [Desulfitobacterium hafniense]|uniref:ArsR family transcriptional regulator n=1 Tax=Desulfitobacterium hafniense TaxID=49338 RepID=A0A0W1JCE2_DESHA|nr:sigma 54-interacting transcriptional regulator [Desulfitobacterium hafniense]KTE89174.1 ArsR family transcriptional regulator [Desulfitobacterium hafniense]
MDINVELPIEALPLKLGLNEDAQVDFSIWGKVKEAKLRYLEQNEDPRKSPYVPIEVAESWIRSKNYGVDPYKSVQAHQLSPKEKIVLAERKEMLIQTAVPLMKKYLSLLSASGYTMLLTDERGVILFIEGDKEKVPEEEFGTIVSEDVTGTNAHTLCAILRKPVQFIGPYNYCIHLDENIVSSTPIFDQYGDLIGTLTIYQLFAEKDIYNMQAHSLGWITSMAYAIENQLKLKQANEELSLSNGTLEATLAVVEGGLITLDKRGMTAHINNEGCRILGITQEETLGEHFTKYLQNDKITGILKDGKAVSNHEIIIDNGETEKQYVMSIYPIVPQDTCNINDKLNGIVIHLSRIENIKKLVNDWRGASATYSFEDIQGKDPLFLKIVGIARQYSKLYANVLIHGESGTGKELFAQAIHNASCPEGPFISINCSAMPRNLIESELFGYEGGAFTGAERKGRPGLIELANEGTLFLDEIGDMPLEIQPVLLRVLEEKKVMRVGGKKYIPVSFRVISASNKNLNIMVQEKTFREDLYYRLAVFKLQIPPLRKRPDDIISLAQFFIKGTSQKVGRKMPVLSKAAQKVIKEYAWPGNVRQLENSMVYAVSLTQGDVIGAEDLPDDITNPITPENSRLFSSVMSLREMEITAIKNALEQTNQNIANAANILGLGKSTLYKKLKEYHLEY